MTRSEIPGFVIMEPSSVVKPRGLERSLYRILLPNTPFWKCERPWLIRPRRNRFSTIHSIHQNQFEVCHYTSKSACVRGTAVTMKISLGLGLCVLVVMVSVSAAGSGTTASTGSQGSGSQGGTGSQGSGSPGSTGGQGSGSPGSTGGQGSGSPGSTGGQGSGSPGSTGGQGSGSPGSTGGQGSGSPGSTGGQGSGSPGSTGGQGSGSPGSTGGQGSGSPGSTGGQGSGSPGSTGGQGSGSPGSTGGQGSGSPGSTGGQGSGSPGSTGGQSSGPSGSSGGSSSSGESVWSEWTPGVCSVTCGNGVRNATRTCIGSASSSSGEDCVGDDVKTESCDSGPCPVDGEWTPWVPGNCSVTCGTGEQDFSRTCTNPAPANGGADCEDVSYKTEECIEDPCPVDGGWSEWTEGPCDVTCGTGNRTDSRTCTNPEPQYDGADCDGEDEQTAECYEGPCPVDGEWTPWVPGSCSVTCGTGEQDFSRTCTNPAPANGGADCNDVSYKTEECVEDPCPVDGNWTDWTTGSCSVTCGSGVRTNTRTCTNPEPQYDGADCDGDSEETEECEEGPCPGDGGWTDWESWDDCSVTCGVGVENFGRSCTNPPPTHGGLECVGDDNKTESCDRGNCPGDGAWSEWTDEGCGVTCGEGVRSLTRTCTNPAPTFGGADCVGEGIMTESCNETPCPVNGEWTSWAATDDCSVTCGLGEQSFGRSCSNPTPAHGGLSCNGSSGKSEQCQEDPCPVDGEWSSWTPTGSGCSVTCGTGEQNFGRTCSNPAPLNGGAQCSGVTGKTEECEEAPCPVNGEWTSWTATDDCSVTCGTGEQSFGRSCSNPTPAHGGLSCNGSSGKSEQCQEDPCPVDGEWTSWEESGGCSVTCGTGERSLWRSCANPPPMYNGLDCVGNNTMTEECVENPCPVDGNWTDWTTGNCSVTCGSGVRTNTRTCTNPEPQYDGADCDGDSEETEECEDTPCPGDGGWTEWESLDDCSVTCGVGVENFGRSCTNPPPTHGGLECVGDDNKTESCDRGNCPGDGAWSEWTDDGCSVSCGDGVRSFTRSCTNPAPTHGGAECEGNATKTEDCNDMPCPVDGGWTSWAEVGNCTVTCGTGEQGFSRSCTNPIPAHNGANCVGGTGKSESCERDPCPVNGGWTEWTEGLCDVTCGTGVRTNTRSCTAPEPQNGGDDCDGNDEETVSCSAVPCPVDGNWTDWEPGMCSVTCGSGEISLTRACTNPVPAHGGAPCDGDNIMTESCQENPCPIDGGWTDWSEWGDCSVTCGDDGEQTFVRNCTAPAPQYQGQECVGESQKTEQCGGPPCSVDGGWSSWTESGDCSVTCGSGEQSYGRTCTNPVPMHGGAHCNGSTGKTESCGEGSCAVDGGWSEWTEGPCDVTCGTGNRTDSRTCTNPEPQYGGADCDGEDDQTVECEEGPCPVDGEWTPWVPGNCSVTCGTGEQDFSRTCTNPAPANGGADCDDVSYKTEECVEDPCPVDGGWSEWTEGPCDVTCGTGNRTDSRTCTNPEPQYDGADCDGEDEQTAECYEGPCPVDGEWTPWVPGSCSVTCGTGEQDFSRTCTNPAPANGGADCDDVSYKTEECVEDPCPVDGNWTDWTTGSCSVTCGSGVRTNTRTCTNPEPQYDGADCDGDSEETEECEEGPCPGDGGWTDWESWDDCSVTCGVGVENFGRSCTNPPPTHGGLECVGDDNKTESCTRENCPGDGAWSEWTDEGCGVTCGEGVRSLTRTCTNPAPTFGGADCVGEGIMTESCNETPCPVNGEWTSWAATDDCSVTCGLGEQSFGRSCSNPTPAHGGLSCNGSSGKSEQCQEDPCPVDGEWSSWTPTGSGCSVTCGTGEQNFGRTCSNPAPLNGGAQCSGVTGKTEECEEAPCPVNGEWTSWTATDDCSVTCGTGEQSFGRSCSNPTPAHGGLSCNGSSGKSEQCQEDPCPVDGQWTSWEESGGCSVTCGTGEQSLWRSCANPPPMYNGLDCVGNNTMTEECVENPCPVDGNWTDWTTGNCSVTCGSGVRTNTRTCTNPEPQYDGADCDGDSEETEECEDTPCPGDGGWTEWESWDDCSVTCGVGVENFGRSCTNPPPTHGGLECVGDDNKTESCDRGNCPGDGAWSEWTDDGCSVSCGDGVRSFTRSCTNPAPTHGGAECEGNATKTERLQ
ncbi:hypothetical protein ScPMuIL_017108 [Solemya velum]